MLTAAAILAGAGLIAWAVYRAADAGAVRDEAMRARQVAILGAFAPAITAAADDPRAIIVWQPVARTARALFPNEFAALDRSSGDRFPFSTEMIRQAHARWTTDWLAWERSHDVEFKRRAAAAHADAAAGATPATRATLDAIENEKLALYQQRYAVYVQVAKALQALSEP